MKPIFKKGCMFASDVWLQIEMAANGCVSGTLKEWPLLQQALFECDVVLNKDSSALLVKLTCQELLKIRDEDRAESAKAAGFVKGESVMIDLLEGKKLEARFDSQPHSFIRIVDSMPRILPEGHTTGDYAVVEAARVSYSGTKKQSDVRTLLRYLLRHKHSSPAEMIEVKYHMAMPIFTARQWIRHRTANVNEQSGRYSVMKELFYVATPENLRKQSNVNKQGRSEQMDAVTAQQLLDKETEHDRRCYELYEERIKAGMAREIARNVLPLNLYTEWYWKLDMHNTMHFLMLRKDSHAQLEIREMAQAMYDLLKPLFPECMEAFDDYIDMEKTCRLSRLEVERIANKQFEPVWLDNKGKSNREEQEFQAKLKQLRLPVQPEFNFIG